MLPYGGQKHNIHGHHATTWRLPADTKATAIHKPTLYNQSTQKSISECTTHSNGGADGPQQQKNTPGAFLNLDSRRLEKQQSAFGRWWNFTSGMCRWQIRSHCLLNVFSILVNLHQKAKGAKPSTCKVYLVTCVCLMLCISSCSDELSLILLFFNLQLTFVSPLNWFVAKLHQ